MSKFYINAFLAIILCSPMLNGCIIYPDVKTSAKKIPEFVNMTNKHLYVSLICDNYNCGQSNVIKTRILSVNHSEPFNIGNKFFTKIIITTDIQNIDLLNKYYDPKLDQKGLGCFYISNENLEKYKQDLNNCDDTVLMDIQYIRDKMLENKVNDYVTCITLSSDNHVTFSHEAEMPWFNENKRRYPYCEHPNAPPPFGGLIRIGNVPVFMRDNTVLNFGIIP